MAIPERRHPGHAERESIRGDSGQRGRYAAADLASVKYSAPPRFVAAGGDRKRRRCRPQGLWGVGRSSVDVADVRKALNGFVEVVRQRDRQERQ